MIDLAQFKAILNKSEFDKNVESPESQSSTNRLALDSGSHSLIAGIVKQAMRKEHIFLRDSLSLQELATHCDVSVHHLSETLNHFIDIAMRSGFSNKSTFNTVFKEIKQQTPSQYRARRSKHSA